MMDTQKIQATLDSIGEWYDRDITEPNFDLQLSLYCKMAALELCGWLEEVYDNVIISFLHRKGLSEKEIENFEKSYVRKVHGLSYSEHFRRLMIDTLGYTVVLDIESKTPKLAALISNLDTLHKYRNCMAHRQYFDYREKIPIKAQQQIISPSGIKSIFEAINPILKEIVDKIDIL